jgi:hypothetical protein
VRILLAALLALLVAVPGAGARTRVASDEGVTNVRVAGERVAYVSEDDGLDSLHVVGGGAARATPFFERGRTSRLFVTGMEASSTRVALGMGEAPQDERGSEPSQAFLFGGPFDADISRSAVLACEPEARFGVSSEGVAAACLGDRGVRVFGGPAGDASIPTQRPVHEVELAGRFMAWEQESAEGVPWEIVVYDLVENSVEYRISGEPVAGPVAFALQEDGKVALAGTGRLVRGGLPCFSKLVWYSPAEPRAHEVDEEVCADQVEMSADSIGYRRASGTELAVGDLTGNARVIGRFRVVHGLTTLTGWDLESGRVAYGERDCVVSRVYVEEVSVADPPGPGPAKCPARLLTRSATLSARGTMRLRLRCPRGCQGEYDVLLVSGDESGLHTDRFLLRPGTRSLVARIPRGIRSVVRGEDRARAVIRIRPFDRVGDLGRETERTIPIRIR